MDLGSRGRTSGRGETSEEHVLNAFPRSAEYSLNP